MAETWRVVLASGEVREVVAYFDESNTRHTVSTHRWCAGGMRSRTPRGAVVAAMTLGDVAVAEILAPGEPTRAELRAQQAPLLDAHDALVAAARAAGWTGAGATGAELVAWVRRGVLLDAARIAMERGGEWVAKAIVARANEEGGE